MELTKAKKVFVWILSLLGALIILVPLFLFSKEKMIGYIAGNSCKSTGGKWIENFDNIYGADNCGRAWFPLTKNQRIKKETTPVNYLSVCPQYIAKPKFECNCSDGSYSGSAEEGCISQSEARSPSKEVQEKYSKEMEQKFTKRLDELYPTTNQ